MKKKLSAHFFFLLLGLVNLFFISCSSPGDTRACVEVNLGARFDSPDEFSHMEKNLFWISKEKNNYPMLFEFPLFGDSSESTHVKFPAPVLKAFRKEIKDKTLGTGEISLAISNSHNQQTFPYGIMNDPQTWFAELGAYADSLLMFSKGMKVQRLIFGKNIQLAEPFLNEWKELFSSLRKKFKIKISYACDIDRIGLVKDLVSISDELAVIYPPYEGEHAIPFSRKNNLEAASIAKRLSLPVFIFQSNLLGENRKTAFDYHLKFWDPEVEISGVCLNSLYGKFVVIDSSSYFGIQGDNEFNAHLKFYSGTCR